jgi:Tfp pilus assembly protein PilF
MKEVFFWSSWQNKYRFFYVLCLFVLLVNTGIYLFASFFGKEYFTGWKTDGEIGYITTLIDEVQTAFFEMPVEVHGFVVSNYFNMTTLKLGTEASNIYLVMLYFGMLLILTASAYMNRLGFILTNAVLILHLSFTSFNSMTFKSNQIDAGDPYNWFFLLCLILFFPLNFILHSRRSKLSLPIRFVLFGLLAGLASYIFVYHYAQVGAVNVFVANYGYLMPMAITFLFAFFFANEIIHGIFYLTAGGGQTSVRNFAVFTTLYLANLAYAFLKSIDYTDFDILYFNPFAVFALTVFLGVWGFRRREPQYESVVYFTPAGAFLYIGFALVALSSMSYAHVTGNSPAVEVYEDLILFSHIGFGFGMGAYVLGNFYLDFSTGENLNPRLWKPNVLSYAAAATFGIIVFILFLFRYDFYMYRQMHAGYANGLADCYWLEGEKAVAEEYYKKALYYDVTNEKANLMLCMLSEERNSPNEIKKYITNAVEKNPSPQFYAYAASVYLRTNDLENAFKILERGTSKNPKSAELYNNLALLQMHMLQGEKAIESFSKARETAYGEKKEIIEGNMYMLWAKFDLNRDMSTFLDKPKNAIGLANYLAVKNSNNEIADIGFDANLVKDSLLTGEQLCYIYNYALNKLKYSESSLLKVIDRSIDYAGNDAYHTFLLFAKANQLYYSGNVHEAILIMRHILSGKTGGNHYHANLLALWLTEHGQYDEASKYFQDAMLGHKNDAALNRAVVLSELDDKTWAVRLWRAFDTLPHHPYHGIAKDMLPILSPDSLKSFDPKKHGDLKKYQYLHYQNRNLSHKTYFEVVKSIEDLNYVANAVLDRIDFVLEQSLLDSALSYRAALTGLMNLNNLTLNRMKLTDLRLLAQTGQYDKMGAILNELEESRQTAGKKKMFKAVYHAGLKTDAGGLFVEAVRANPFNAFIYEQARNYFNEKGEKEKAYEILLDGIKVAPEDTKILKMYVFQCLDLGYETYAEIAYRDLRSFITPEERKILHAEYEKALEKMRERAESW